MAKYSNRGKKQYSAEQRKRYNEESIAFKTCTNWGGIEIMSVNDERVTVRDNYGNPSKKHSAKVRYNANGEPYFKHNGRREYFRDYMRCK